jgi:sec-independent protein translocase protein TatA
MLATLIIISSTLAFGMPGGMEWLVIIVIALLIFGKRLPELGRSLGRGIIELKRGLGGRDDDDFRRRR